MSVKDTGIPREMLSKVFQMFTQLDQSLERTQSGLGIGLTLVKRLVEMHDGTVTARSEGRGRGSEFIVELPILKDVPPEVKTPDHEQETKTTPPKRRILVVDDNRDSAMSLSMMLKLMGNETTTAYDGVAAIDVANEFRPDLIMLDIGLPKLNGFDACRKIREQPWAAETIIVALTGWSQDEDRRRSTDAGFDHHMVKPVEIAALEKLLQAVPTASR